MATAIIILVQKHPIQAKPQKNESVKITLFSDVILIPVSSQDVRIGRGEEVSP